MGREGLTSKVAQLVYERSKMTACKIARGGFFILKKAFFFLKERTFKPGEENDSGELIFSNRTQGEKVTRSPLDK